MPNRKWVTDFTGSQLSIAFAETLVLEGIAPWKRRRRRRLHRATTIGLFKTECVGRGDPILTGPLRTIDDVKYADHLRSRSATFQ